MLSVRMNLVPARAWDTKVFAFNKTMNHLEFPRMIDGSIFLSYHPCPLYLIVRMGSSVNVIGIWH